MAGIDAFGTILEIDVNDDAFATGLTVGEITTVDFLDVSVDDLDATTHGSPGQWREFIGGLKNGGTLTGTIRFDPALHGAILSAVGVTHDVRITLPDAGAASIDFEGYINMLTGVAPHDGLLEGEFGLKASGAPVLTP